MVDTANTRARLKRAKELIEEQQWEKAQDILQRICTEDAQNVQALVLSGKCALELQQRDRALQMFVGAVKCQGELLAGWQGLLAWHKRFGAGQDEVDVQLLLEGYRRCLEPLQKDEQQMKPKLIEYLRGYAPLLATTGQNEEALKNWDQLAQLATGYGNKEVRVEALRSIIRTIVPLTSKHHTDFVLALPAEILQRLLQTFDTLLSEYDLATLEDGYAQEHLSILLRLERLPEADAVARRYMEQYKELAPFAVAVLYMLHLERDLLGAPHDAAEMDGLQTTVAGRDGQHPLIRLRKGLAAYRQRTFAKCSDLLEKALLGAKGLPSLPAAYQVPLLQRLDLLPRKFLAIAWVCAGDATQLAEAVGMLTEYRARMPSDWQVFFYCGYAQLQLDRTADAESTYYTGVQAFSAPTERNEQMLIGGLKGIVEFANGNFPSATELLESALLLAEDNHVLHYYLFRCLWGTGQRDPRRCLRHLKRALEVYPDFAMGYMYLGLWMWLQERDVESARAHLDKAYAGLPTDPTVVQTLTDFLTVNYMDTQAVQILQTALASRAFPYDTSRWMRLRLALLCYRNQLWLECIGYLRQSIIDFPEERLVQELLGDALAFRGNYGSAEGMFGKVVEASGDAQISGYSLFRRATLKQVMKLDAEAEAELLLLKEQSPWFRSMCLQNLALLYIRKAQTAFADYSPLLAMQSIQRAIDLLSEIVLSGKASAMVWTLLGDACLLARHCHPGNASASGTLSIDQFLWDGSPAGSRVELNVRQILYSATLFYAAAVSQKRTSARLCERLAMAQLALAERLLHASDLPSARQWWNKALLAGKEMLQRSPLNPSLWSTLGAILMSPAADAGREGDTARALTQAVALYNRANGNPTCTAATWTGLGFVLLNRRRFLAAHQVLKVAQNADPNLAGAWLGQAWCAERTGHTLEAMDLCRHACALGRPPQAMRRYAEWVVWVLLKSQMEKSVLWEVVGRLEAIPTALDYLEQCTHVFGENIKSYSVGSILGEWAGLWRSSLDRAQKALQLLNEASNPLDQGNRHATDDAKLDTARLLSQVGQHAEALDMLGSVDSEPTVSTVLLLMLVNFRLGNYEEADGLLEVLRDMVADDENQAELVSCVQMVRCVVRLYWILQGGGPDADILTDFPPDDRCGARYRALIAPTDESMLAVSRLLHRRPLRPDVRLHLAETLASRDPALARHFALTACALSEDLCGEPRRSHASRLALGASRIPAHRQLDPNGLHLLMKMDEADGTTFQKVCHRFPWLVLT